MSKRSRHLKKDGLILEELFRSEVLEYEMVYYDTRDGERDDPATQVERRVAVFKVGTAPENITAAYDASRSKSSYSYSYFDGLPNALLDNVVEVTQQYDYEAQRIREEEERLLQPRRVYNPRTYEYEEQDGSEFLEFWEAVDRVEEDESDEQAWDTIARWRSRQLRAEERV